MAKIHLSFEFDAHKDKEALLTQVLAADLCSAIYDARQLIRDRLKYHSVTDEEETLLEKLQDVLYVEGLEW